MEYVWDPTKDALNRRKHGVPLADAIPALQDPNAYSWIDDRFYYDEPRIITLGRNEQAVLVVVSTERGWTDDTQEEITRIISVRYAVKLEIDWYFRGRRET
jgi:uncharacterized protein